MREGVFWRAVFLMCLRLGPAAPTKRWVVVVVVVVVFAPSHLLSSPLFSIFLLIVVTQIRGHMAGSSRTLPTTTGRALYFYPEKIFALSSLVDSRRIVPTHARRSQ